MAKEISSTESSRDYLLHLMHENKKCFVRARRDFLIYSHSTFRVCKTFPFKSHCTLFIGTHCMLFIVLNQPNGEFRFKLLVWANHFFNTLFVNRILLCYNY